MRAIVTLIFVFGLALVQAQIPTFQKDTLLVIGKKPMKGFHHEYILYVPKGTPLNKKIYLLVEPNNTGRISDSIQVHQAAAIALAGKSSVGNNVSRMLTIPLLVPVFPRPEADSLMYTHALDRDVMLAGLQDFKRLDLQLLRMTEDAKSVLNSISIEIEDKFFMCGFSASGTFTNRFSMIHPGRIRALAIGGFNGKLMIPQMKLGRTKLNYPLGLNDFKQLFSKPFDIVAYRAIPQFIYMGRTDDNDAVQYDDAYSADERAIINTLLGKPVHDRFLKCQELYRENQIQPNFKTFDGVGHWTTTQMNLEIIDFFRNQMTR